MRMFTLDEQGSLVPYIEKAFGDTNTEADLKNILENNPGYFFEEHKILIIGRVTTQVLFDTGETDFVS